MKKLACLLFFLAGAVAGCDIDAEDPLVEVYRQALMSPLPTTAPLPAPIVAPTPVAVPVPTVVKVSLRPASNTVLAPPGCASTVPDYVYLDGGVLIQPSGTPLWVVQEAIWIDGQARWCDGDRWLRVSWCEGLSEYNQWSETRNNGQGAGHVGFFQISAVHHEAIPGGFPAGISFWQGNIAFAAELRDNAIDRGHGDGLGDWRPWSGYCFD